MPELIDKGRYEEIARDFGAGRIDLDEAVARLAGIGCTEDGARIHAARWQQVRNG